MMAWNARTLPSDRPTVFGFIDGVSNKMAYLGGKLTQGVVGLINKVTGLKRRKDEDDFYE